MPASAFRALIVSAALAIVCALSGSAAAQTSSTVAGTIKDAHPSAAMTITNNQYNVDGSLNTARLTPATAGAGAATAAQAMHSMQMQIRFRF